MATCLTFTIAISLDTMTIGTATANLMATTFSIVITIVSFPRLYLRAAALAEGLYNLTTCSPILCRPHSKITVRTRGWRAEAGGPSARTAIWPCILSTFGEACGQN